MHLTLSQRGDGMDVYLESTLPFPALMFLSVFSEFCRTQWGSEPTLLWFWWIWAHTPQVGWSSTTQWQTLQFVMCLSAEPSSSSSSPPLWLLIGWWSCEAATHLACHSSTCCDRKTAVSSSTNMIHLQPSLHKRETCSRRTWSERDPKMFWPNPRWAWGW